MPENHIAPVATPALKFFRIWKPLASLTLLACFTPQAWAGFVHPDVLAELAQAESTADRGITAEVEVLVTLKDELPLRSGDADELARYAAALESQRDTVLTQTSLTSRRAEVKTFSHLPVLHLRGDRQLIEELANHPAVDIIGPMLVDHPMMGQARNIGSVATVTDSLLHRGSGIAVAVLDTGIHASHSDFSGGAIVAQKCFAGCTAGADQAPDHSGHGTHVAGMITRSNGTAPDAKIVAVKVLGPNGSEGNSVLDGLNWVLANHQTHNIRVVNMSLGGGRYYNQNACDVGRASQRAAIINLRNAGILTVVASGNDGWTDSMGGPGCVTEAVGVGSIGDASFIASFSNCTDNAQADKVSCFSNAHNTGNHQTSMLDLLAPGCQITSTGTPAGTSDKCGTSMATPFVAGVAAGLFGRAPSANPNDIESLMVGSAVMRPDYRTPGMGYPRVNALGAHNALPAHMVPPNDPLEGRIEVTSFPATYNEHRMAYASSYTAGSGAHDPDTSLFCNRLPRHTLWWTFLRPNRSRVFVTTEGSSGNIADTVMGNYRLTTNGWVQLSCNDDFQGNYLARSTFVAEAGSRVYTMIGHYHDLATSTRGNLRVVLHAVDTPANDLTGGAIVLPDTATAFSSTVSQAHGATETVDEPAFSCRTGGAGAGYQTLWWRFTTPSWGRITLTHQSATGAYGDSLMAVYKGSQPLVSNEVACNDDASGTTRAALADVSIEPGHTYWVQLASKTEISVTQASSATLRSSFTAEPRIDHGLAAVTLQLPLAGTGSFPVSFRNISPGSSLQWQIRVVQPSQACNIASNIPWLIPAQSSGNLAHNSTPHSVAVAVNVGALAAGTHEAKLCLTSNDPTMAQVAVPVTLHVREVVFAPATLADIQVGEATSVSLTLSGAGTTAPYQITLGAGSLPDGMSIDGTSLMGTPTTHGSFPFTLNAVDGTAAAQGGPFTGSRQYNLTTRAAVAAVPADASFLTATDGQRSLNLPVANSGNTALTLSHATTGIGCDMAAAPWLSATIPASIAPETQADIGLSVDADGLSAGTYAATVCLDTNDPYQPRHSIDVTLEVRAMEISPATLPSAITGAPYAYAFEVEDAASFTAPFNFTSAGTLPDGLVLDAAGELSGTAGMPGMSQFSVRVSDSTPAAEGGPFSGELAYTFHILDIDMFSDGFEQPLFGVLALDNYGKASLTLPLVELLAHLGDSRAMHLFDLMIGARRMGVVEGHCEAGQCSIRIIQHDAHGRALVGDWITVDSEPMQVQLRVGENSRGH
ncbi:S8 family serine peptidase [Xanthomonadaceae bacterium JHOS43]|nr:S8 family serine peptidase [Xanthomonadaceae bacterium JHOS43]